MNFGKIRVAVMTAGSLSLCASLLLSTAFAKPPAKPTKPTAAQIAAGKKVYEAQMCKGCHVINGDGGGTSGPDLSKVAAEAKHTAEWLKVQVIKPKDHNANTAMPGYEDKIKGADLTNLTAYLGTLKGTPEKPAK